MAACLSPLSATASLTQACPGNQRQCLAALKPTRFLASETSQLCTSNAALSCSSLHTKISCPGTSLLPSAAQGAGKKLPSLVVEARAGKNVKTTRQTIVPDPDIRIPVVLLGGAAGLVYADNLLAAAPVGLLGLLLLFQSTRVRFVFDDEALEVKVGEELKESGENVFVGGKNRWKYSTFVNWEMWWPSFPVLVYFKETQTKPEGQVHFFPVIFNGKQLYDVMVERAGRSQNSGPK